MGGEMQHAIRQSLEWACGLKNYEDLDPHGYRVGHLALQALFAAYVRPSEYQAVVGGANAVYGWMPTIFRGVSPEGWTEAKCVLERLSLAHDWEMARDIVVENPTVMKLISGSVVGTSKFLHFMNPNVFPIWDSNVQMCLGSARRLPVNFPSSYLAYGDAFWAVLSDGPAFSSAYLEFVGREVTAVRQLEFALFLHGRHIGAQRPRRQQKSRLVA